QSRLRPSALQTHRTRRRTALRAEELESRQLLSIAGPDLATLVAQPAVDLAPAATTSAPAPYTPAQVRHAYGFDQLSQNGAGQTIAIVDAYDAPTISNDLDYFDRTYSLTQYGSASSFLTKVFS